MPLVSVITPVYQPVAEHLREAYESLKSQTLPNGWEWEWIVQEDGETQAPHEILPNDPQIRFGTGRRGGVALTRNLALGQSRGTLVKNLDADDVLTPGTLARDVEAIQSEPEVRWTTCRVLDLLPDGSTVGFDSDPPEGRLEPGTVLRHWHENNYRLPVHPTTICIDRELLVTLGGWMGIPASEDTGLVLAASSVSVGRFISEVGLHYRKWHGQATANDAHHDETERDTRTRLIAERAEMLHRAWFK